MVSFKEFKSRIKTDLRFSEQERSSLIIAVIFTAIIFSFRDWGKNTFDVAYGLKNLFLVAVIATVSFLFRFSCQKMYALSRGYKAEFKVWWAGLIIALLLAFLSAGRISIILIGGVVASFMVKYRLGEFRYGFSYSENAMISLWGVYGNMILAVLFSIGLYYVPNSYFFEKGLLFNVIMSFCSLLPLPQLEGLTIFFGSRPLYVLGWVITILGTVLLFSKTTFGLIASIVIGSLIGIVYIIIGSEK